MSDIAIRVENLSKQYRIGGPEVRYRTLRESLVGAAQAPFRRMAAVARGESPAGAKETIWALKDVSFEVKHGEVLGIIGRNGAGKSTLLKVLSRITAPTEGTVDLYGRVGSLLEVGTGFHPELTGRENIYLSGAILGMTRAEIEKKFDEIVAFAEQERFLDTPVKHYSSGMSVRLAFAVAAHLEPEILLVDEVLAVGDAAFQKKCLGKMGEVAGEGRTVLFVSHSMAMITSLCKWVLLLDEGRTLLSGLPQAVTSRYLTNAMENSKCWSVDHSQLNENAPIHISEINVLDLDGQPLRCASTGSGLILRLRYQIDEGYDIPAASFVVRVKSRTGIEVLRLSNTPISGFPIFDLVGAGKIDLMLPMIPFTEDQYTLDVGLARQAGGFYVEYLDVVSLFIIGSDIYGSGTALDSSRGITTVPHRWIHEPSKGIQVDSGLIGGQLLRPSETRP